MAGATRGPPPRAALGWVFVYVVANQLAYVVIIILAGGRRRPLPGLRHGVHLLPAARTAIFAVSIFTALLPAMAERWTDGDIDGVARPILARAARHDGGDRARGARLLALAQPIMSLLLEYGAVHAVPTPSDRRARCRAFAVGLPFFSAFQLLTRTFYATQDSRTPALVNIGAAIVTVAVDVDAGGAVGWASPAWPSATPPSTSSRPPSGSSCSARSSGRSTAGTDRRHDRSRACRRPRVTASSPGSSRRGGRRGRHPDGGRAGRPGGRAVTVGGWVCICSAALMLGIEEVDEVEGRGTQEVPRMTAGRTHRDDRAAGWSARRR